MLYPFSLCLAALPARVIAFPSRSSPVRADEPALVLAARGGARAAQHALYSLYVRQVRGRVRHLLGCPSDADDVVQDTFVIAFRDLNQLTDPQRFGAWLCSIAVHQVHRRLRRRQLLRRLGLDRGFDEPGLAAAVDPSAGPFVRTMLKQIDEGLSHLPPTQRIAWVLRHVEGASLDETAEQCRMSLATVKRHIAKAEASLREHLDFERVAGDTDDG